VVWRAVPDHPADGRIAWLWFNRPPAAEHLTTRLAPENWRRLREARERLGVSLSPIELGRLSFDPLNLTELPGREMQG
jgi:hypothetical protein